MALLHASGVSGTSSWFATALLPLPCGGKRVTTIAYGGCSHSSVAVTIPTIWRASWFSVGHRDPSKACLKPKPQLANWNYGNPECSPVWSVCALWRPVGLGNCLCLWFTEPPAVPNDFRQPHSWLKRRSPGSSSGSAAEYSLNHLSILFS